MAVDLAELDVPFVSLNPAKRKRAAAEPDRWLVRNEVGYAVIAYDDVLAVLRDARWHSALADAQPRRDAAYERWRAARQPNILALEGADHGRFRRVFSGTLTPKRIERQRPMMRELFADLLDPTLRAGAAEFMGELAHPYAQAVLFRLLGAPDGWAARWSELMAARPGPDASSTELIDGAERVDAFARELLDTTGPGGHGLLATIVRAEGDGRLAPAEAVVQTESLLLAGIDSTAGQLGLAMWLFGRFPDEYARLQAHPELVPNAIEETLRFQGAARGTLRRASVDIVHRDVRFPRGTLLMLGFITANRDPTVFDDPMRFDPARRPDRPHLTFGHGAHFCLGAALARAELHESLATLVERVPAFDLAADVVWRPATADFWGPERLMVDYRTSTTRGVPVTES